MKDLISIIIPVYNEEKYLDKCISSIVNQTYGNLEIILVDDESPDKCPQICNRWSKKDKRIKVVHKQNGGVASSRNEGLKNATGTIIGFVDSDDYIEKDMFEKLYKNLMMNNADISMCSYYDEYIDGRKKMGKHFDDFTIINGIDAIKNLLLEKNISNHLWNKIYKKELFDKIEFPLGRKMEDLSVMYRLFEKSKIIVFDNYIGYHYLQHENSIMGNVNEKLINDYELAAFDRNKDLLKKYSNLELEININNITMYKLLHYLAFLSGNRELFKSDKYKEYYKKYRKEYLKYRKKIKDIIGNKSIASYDIFWLSKHLYFLIISKKKILKG